jgi:hypothetical protein
LRRELTMARVRGVTRMMSFKNMVWAHIATFYVEIFYSWTK